ncbi:MULTISPECIES: hypothetical protein [unclassified Zymobacter]
MKRLVAGVALMVTMLNGATIRFKNSSGSEAVNRVFFLDDDPI